MMDDLEKLINEIDALYKKVPHGPWVVVNDNDCWRVWNGRPWESERIFDDGSSAGEYGKTCGDNTRDLIISIVHAWPQIRDALRGKK